ncbi:MAG: hypothetical protein R2751_01595 [Bacteroidales bacterium]
MRAEGDCNNTAAVNTLVTVKDPSTDPTSITITNDNTCQGTAKTLTVVGGSLGTGADWYWYSDAAFTVSEGSGASISVDPAVSTTYYVRAEGDCNNTAAVNARCDRESLRRIPSITITNDNTCQGTAKTPRRLWVAAWVRAPTGTGTRMPGSALLKARAHPSVWIHRQAQPTMCQAEETATTQRR